MGCFQGEFKQLQIRVGQEIKDRFQSYFFLIFF